MFSKFFLYVIMNLFLLFNTIDTCSPSFFSPSIESAPSLARTPSASNIVQLEKPKNDERKKEVEEDGRKKIEERHETSNVIKSLVRSILQRLKP